MMVIRSGPRQGATKIGMTTVNVEPVGCGKPHNSMLEWQNCALCHDLPRYAAYVGQPRFIEPPPPPEPEQKPSTSG